MGLEGQARQHCQAQGTVIARGFIQQEGIDFEEVFTRVARMESVHLLLALAAAND